MAVSVNLTTPTAPVPAQAASPPAVSAPAPGRNVSPVSATASADTPTVSSPKDAPVARSSQGAASAQPGPSSNPAKSAGNLAQAMAEVKNYFTQADQDVTLNVDRDSGQTYVKFVNAETKQVILQIPPEEVLVMARKLRGTDSSQPASGVLVDQEG